MEEMKTLEVFPLYIVDSKSGTPLGVTIWEYEIKRCDLRFRIQNKGSWQYVGF